MAVDALTSEVQKPSLDFLADINAVHEIVPRRRLRKGANELDGFGLNVPTFRDCGRHEKNMPREDVMASGSFG